MYLRRSRLNNGCYSPNSKTTQWETVDLRMNACEIKSTIPDFSPNEFLSINEIAQRLEKGDKVEIYDTVKTDSTNFSVFHNIHEQTFSHDIFGKSSLRKNLSLLKYKHINFKTKSELEKETIKELRSEEYEIYNLIIFLIFMF